MKENRDNIIEKVVHRAKRFKREKKVYGKNILYIYLSFAGLLEQLECKYRSVELNCLPVRG